MANLTELLALPGALASFEFNGRGELLRSEMKEVENLDDSVLDLLSHVCVANTSISAMQARGWEKVTGMSGFYPIEGFTMIGVDWSTVVRGNTGVVLDNDSADYQAAYDLLNQQAGEEQ
ncbi:MAG TPA: DUF2173 family protein [Gammaproteobacteria bacterium]|nr:DUF2173 family protein [Gammaproteobacteria bacterium]